VNPGMEGRHHPAWGLTSTPAASDAVRSSSLSTGRLDAPAGVTPCSGSPPSASCPPHTMAEWRDARRAANDSCFLQCVGRPSHGIMLECRSGVS